MPYYLYILLIFSINSHAQDTKTLHQVEQKISHMKRQIAQKKANHADLTIKLAQTEININNISNRILDINNALKQQEQQLKKTQNEIKTTKEKIQQHKKSLSNSFYIIYTLKNKQPLELLFSDAKHQIFNYYHHIILQTNYNILQKQFMLSKLLLDQEESLHKETKILNNLHNTLNLEKQQTTNFKQERMLILQDLNKHMLSQEQKLNAFVASRSKLNTIINTQIHKKAHPGNSFINMRGKLPAPVTINTKAKKFSHGVLFPVSLETPVLAIHKGRVSFANWINYFGLLIIIDHGDGYMSLYAHNEFIAKKVGDIVQANEIISYSGQSGGITKPGLYFELRKNGQTISPVLWMNNKVKI